jgi:DNA-binding beta-propeller fold protein YncE
LFALRSIGAFLASVLLASSLITPASAQSSPSECATAGVDDKCESWVAIFDDETAAASSDGPAEIAVAPDGDAVYALMRSTTGSGFNGRARWVVIRYDTAGNPSWTARWGEASNHNIPTSIAVSPDGERVFVSGTWKADQVTAEGHLTTLALDATTGEMVWSSNYDGPGHGTDNARKIVVSPDGRSLYIAGISGGDPDGNLDYLALAYETRTGAEQWSTRWDGIGADNDDSPFDIAVSRRGDMLYLTGWSYGEGDYNNDYGTIAVRTRGEEQGSIAWTARYDGVGVHAPDQVSALALSPDDSTLFVTGMSNDVDSGPPFDVNYGYATIAYDARTGDQLWEARKYWPDTTFNSPNAIAVDPSGSRVVITGQAGSGQLDYGTVAYDTATGTEVWSDRYGLVEHDLELGRHLVMDPRGGTVYVTGLSAKSPPGVRNLFVLHPQNGDQLTIAYDIATGEANWMARYRPSTTDLVSVQSMAISPDARRVYTAASIDDQNWDQDGDDNDAAVMAYELGAGIPIPPPPPTTLQTFGATEADHSDDATLAARLTNSYGDPIEGAVVNFGLDGRPTSATTNGNGVAQVERRLLESPGTYPLEIAYEGEEGVYSGTTYEDFFTVRREDVSLDVKLKRKARVLQAKLVDADSGAPIEGRKITFSAGSTRLGSTSTDASGKAVRSVPKRIKLDKVFKAGFAGDPFYEGAGPTKA